jgi:hypothetical protein
MLGRDAAAKAAIGSKTAARSSRRKVVMIGLKLLSVILMGSPLFVIAKEPRRLRQSTMRKWIAAVGKPLRLPSFCRQQARMNQKGKFHRATIQTYIH